MPRSLTEEKELIEQIRRKLLTRMSRDDMLNAVSPGEALIALAVLHAAAVICDDLQDIDVSISGITIDSD